jgi:hypothetical protein
MSFLVLAGLVSWYGMGLLASLVGMMHMNAKLDRRYPARAPHLNDTSDTVFMAAIALLGPCNAFSVFLYCLSNE